MATEISDGTANRVNEIRAIKACLDQLGDHAVGFGLPLVANLIGAASRAIADEMTERQARNQDWKKSENQLFDA